MENDRHGQHWSTWLLWKEGKSGTEIHQLLQKHCGDGTPTDRTVRRWIQEFSEGRNTAAHLGGAGRPATAVTHENVERVGDLIAEDPRITTREICHQLGIGSGPLDEILHQHLHVNKVSARWVPRTLTLHMKLDRVNTCRELLQMEEQGGPGFLDRFVTGDESWFHFYEPESRRSSMEWREVGQAPPTKVRTTVSAGKRMASVFWDRQGILLIKWLPEGRTVNSTYYCEVLRDLRTAIREKRRGKLTHGVLLQHDNARPHTSDETMAVIHELGFTVVPHPPYSPDLAPSDYALFAEMKKPLRGKRYETLQQLASAVSKWVSDTPADFFSSAIDKLHERWAHCVTIRGNWVEVHAEDDG